MVPTLVIIHMQTGHQNFSFGQQGDRGAEANLGAFIRLAELSMYRVIGRKQPKRPV